MAFGEKVQFVIEVIKKGDGAEQTEKSIKKMSAAAKVSKTEIAAAGAAIVASLGAVAVASISMASEFETRMANVATLMDGDVSDSIDKLSSQLMDIETPTSLNELAEGLFFVQSAGIDASESVQYLTDANKLAIAGATDTSTSIKALVGFMKAYGDESVDSGKAAELLFNINKKGFTTFEEIAGATSKVAAQASLLGVSQEELAASMSTLVGATGNADEVSTQLKATFTALGKPSEKMQETLNKIGFESGFAAVEALGFKGTLDELREASGGTDESFSKLFSNVRAISGVMPLAGSLSEQFTANMEEMADTAGVVQEAFDKQTATFSAQAALLKKSLMVQLTKLGLVILPPLTKAIEALSAAVKIVSDWFSNLSPETQKIIGILAGVTVAVVALTAAAAVFSVALGGVAAAFGAIFIAALPWIAIGAAIAAGLYLLYEAFDSNFLGIKDIVMSVFEFLSEKFGTIINEWAPLIMSAWENVITIMSDAITFIKDNIITPIFDAITQFIGENWETIKATAMGAWEFLTGFFDTTFGVIIGIVKAFLQLMSGDFDGAWETIKQTAVNFWEGLKSIFTGAWDVLVGILKLNWEIVKNLFSDTWDLIREGFQSFVDYLTELWQGFWDGVMSIFDAIIITITTAGLLLYQLFTGDWEGFLETLKFAWETVWNGIKSFFENIWGTIKSVGKSLWDGAVGLFKTTWDGAGNYWEDKWNWMKTTIIEAAVWMNDFFNGEGKSKFESGFENMVGGIVGIAKSAFNAVLGSIEWFVNSAIKSINRIIQAANNVPGVSIGMIGEISFGKLAHGGKVGAGAFGGEALSEGIQSFAAGGVVSGDKGLDRVPILASDGEIVLNAAMQRSLANELKGGNRGEQTLVVEVKGNNFYGDDESFADRVGNAIVEQLELHTAFQSF